MNTPQISPPQQLMQSHQPPLGQQQHFGQIHGGGPPGFGQHMGGHPLPQHILAQRLAEQFLNSMGSTSQSQVASSAKE